MRANRANPAANKTRPRVCCACWRSLHSRPLPASPRLLSPSLASFAIFPTIDYPAPRTLRRLRALGAPLRFLELANALPPRSATFRHYPSYGDLIPRPQPDSAWLHRALGHPAPEARRRRRGSSPLVTVAAVRVCAERAAAAAFARLPEPAGLGRLAVLFAGLKVRVVADRGARAGRGSERKGGE